MNRYIEQIKKRTDEIFEDIVALRRHLHMYPELSEQEEQTSLFIQQQLRKLGIPFESGIAGNGVSAVIYGKDRAHGIALRADIDALPLTEMTDLPYKSQNPGVMHACGHDIHTAILLGTAQILNEMKQDLPGSVKLLFQPAEETVGGARQMIDAGCLNDPKISSVLGIHVDPNLSAGLIQITPGVVNAASMDFSVTVRGKTCHGAHPTEGIDALLPACNMVSSLQSIITRNMDPVDPALITVGTFHSGTKENIISGEAVFTGIIRTLNVENRERIKARLKQLCTSVAEAYGAECIVRFLNGYPTLDNDPVLYDWMLDSAEAILGKGHLQIEKKPSLGADDFAYFCHGSRGLYYVIGSCRPGEETAAPLHSEHFCADEECIRTGILTQTAAALKILKEESKNSMQMVNPFA